MDSLLKEQIESFQRGNILKGKVVGKAGDDVVIDVGLKSEGLVHKGEFENYDALEIGDIIEVLLEELEDETGAVRLSKRKADRIRGWEKIIETKKEDDVIEGKCMRKIKGGLLVDIGVPVFLPASQVDIRRPGDIGAYIGRSIRAVILKIDEERRNIVISRRRLIEREREQAKRQLLETVKEGDLIKGTVTNIADFGAFVDVGGLDGLLHITDMTWGRINHPSDLLRIGDAVEVKILNINHEKEKIALGLKQKEASPWETIEEKYPVGCRAKGSVVNLVSYGAFVQLEEGIEGLVHISEMSWTKRINHPSELFQVGDEIKVKVLKFDAESERVSLGLKQIQPDPWVDAGMRYPIGKRLEGRVVSLTDYGAFIELEAGIEGLVHVSEMSWTKRVKHPSKVVSVGDSVEAVVLDVDERERKISLGMKQIEPNPWSLLEEKYPPGSRIKGVVRNVTNFGVFVGIDEDGIDGLIHVSDISWTQKIRDPKDLYKKGDEVEAVVLKIDKDSEKFSLGIKQLSRNPWEDVPANYPVGRKITGKVSSVADFGVFVELEEGIEGLVYASEVGKDIENLRDVVKEGDEVQALVVRIDSQEQKMALSMRAIADREEREAIQRVAQQSRTQKATLGDQMSAELLERLRRGSDN